MGTQALIHRQNTERWIIRLRHRLCSPLYFCLQHHSTVHSTSHTHTHTHTHTRPGSMLLSLSTHTKNSSLVPPGGPIALLQVSNHHCGQGRRTPGALFMERGATTVHTHTCS